MKTSLECTSDMFGYLYDHIQENGADFGDVKVFKDDDKPASYKGKYIAINCIPFTFGKALSTFHAMNVNLHAPKLKSGKPDRVWLERMFMFLTELIPIESAVEDGETLYLNGVEYAIHQQTRPMEDIDGTYFINVRLSLTFNGI